MKELVKENEQPAAEETPQADKNAESNAAPKEYGGRKGPEPTRYGDWESKGICTDF